MENNGIRITSTRQNRFDGTWNITFAGIPYELREKVEGVVTGHQWMTTRNGELVFSPTREPLPGPVEDESMLPFWRRYDERQLVMKEFVFDSKTHFALPSFMIKHLCGYDYTPENYRDNAALLTSYRFVCMRSPRGDDGRYDEIWYLPGAVLAKGGLALAIAGLRQKRGWQATSADTLKEETDVVTKFLCEHISFGTLDVVIQRAAMAVPE